MNAEVPFRLGVSQYRRRKILDAITLTKPEEKEKREKGTKIL